jgi:signal transduction histidine kinase
MTNKRLRFIKIAQYRTNQIVRYIDLLSNCSNRNNYEYSEEEITKIFSFIESEIRVAKAQFKPKSNKKFKL